MPGWQMRLNALICEYCDNKDRGYVPVADFIKFLCALLVFVFVGCVFALFMGIYFYGGYLAIYDCGHLNEQGASAVTLFWSCSAGLLAFGAIYAIIKLLPIKIARCELKSSEMDEEA